jgi:Stress responsive A/B Barrel Domain
MQTVAKDKRPAQNFQPWFVHSSTKDRSIGREKGSDMANARRRTLLRTGCAALGGSLLALHLPETTRAQSTSVGVFHVFAFQWKPATTDAQKDRARKDIKAFQGVIPGLLQTNVGDNISPRGKGYTFGGIMQFKDESSLDAYFQHPAHQALLAWLVPLIDAVELDLRA